MKSGWLRSSLIYIIILVAVVILLYQLFPLTPKPAEIGLDEAIAMSQNGQISELVVDSGELHITTTTDIEMKATIGSLPF